MAQAAADGAGIAHRPIGDPLGDARQDAVADVGRTAVGDRRMGDAGADGHRLHPVSSTVPSSGRWAIANQQRGTREAQIEHRPERLAAGQQLCAGPVPRQRARGLRETIFARTRSNGAGFMAASRAP